MKDYGELCKPQAVDLQDRSSDLAHIEFAKGLLRALCQEQEIWK
jgi:hypothetical protein